MPKWPFKRKPQPRRIVKDPKPAPPAIAERLKNKPPTGLRKLTARFRKEPEAPSKLPNFGESVRRERNRQHSQEKLRKVAIPLVSRLKLGFRVTTVVAIVAVVGVVGGIIFLNNKQVYVVKDITITGNKQIATQAIMDEVSDLRGKSMFSFSEAGIESKLAAKFPYIKLAQVRKQLPGKLTVDIEERYPTVAYVNLNGVFLVDDERIVVSQLGLKQSDPLTSDEMLVISGYGDPNANYSYEHYLSKISDEEQRKAVKWDEVTIGEKKQALNEYRDSLVLRVDTTLNNNVTALLGTEFTQLPRIMGYDAQVYDIGSSFSEFRYAYSTAIEAYLTAQNLPYNRMVWESDFTLAAELTNGIKLLFSSTRDIKDQLSALNTVRSQGDLSGAHQVDLRSEIVAVR